MLAPDVILDDASVIDPRTDRPLPHAQANQYSPGNTSMSAYHKSAPPAPKMLLLTTLWTIEGEQWMHFQDAYHLAGLHDGKPVVTRRPISLEKDLGTRVQIVSRGDQGEA